MSSNDDVDGSEEHNIYDIAGRCDGLFQEWRARLAQDKNEIYATIRDYHIRYERWVESVGALATERASLDSRLLPYPDIQDLVLQMLQMLESNLSYSIRYDGHLRNLEAQEGSDFSGKEHDSLLQDSQLPTGEPSSQGGMTKKSAALASQVALDAVHGTIERLYRIEIAIRRSSTSNLTSRVKNFTHKRDAAENAQSQKFMSLRLNALFPSISESLLSQLVVSISYRRFRLLYQKEHQERLGTRGQGRSDKDPSIESPKRHTAILDAVQEISSVTEKGSSEIQQSLFSKIGEASSTDYSEFDLSKYQIQETEQHEAKSDDVSVTSIAQDYSYPRPPELEDSATSTTCTWCYEELLASQLEKPGWWKSHFKKDLEPYVCISEDCLEPAVFFTSFSSWRRHMDEVHTVEWARTIHNSSIWYCNLEPNEYHEFLSADELREHITTQHLGVLTERQIARRLTRNMMSSPRKPNICPLCNQNVLNIVTMQQELVKSNQKGKTVAKNAKESKKQSFQNMSHSSSSEEEIFPHEPEGSSVTTIDDDSQVGLHEKMAIHVASHLKSLAFLSIRYIDDNSGGEEAESLVFEPDYGETYSDRRSNKYASSEERLNLHDSSLNERPNASPTDSKVQKGRYQLYTTAQKYAKEKEAFHIRNLKVLDDVVKLSETVVSQCDDYKSQHPAAPSIHHVLKEVSSISTTSKTMLNVSANDASWMSQEVYDALFSSGNDLITLRFGLERLMSTGSPLQRLLGRRNTAWPFTDSQTNKIVANLHRCQEKLHKALAEMNDMRHLGSGSSNPPPSHKPVFSVPYEVDCDFVDRPDLLAWMVKHHESSAGAMALVGLAGIGKSQAAIQFAHHIHKVSPECSVLWIDAGSQQSFERSFLSIANILHPRLDGPPNRRGMLVRDWLSNEHSGPWVLILDNYIRERHSAWNHPWLPNNSGSYKSVLATSRDYVVGFLLTRNIDDICKVTGMDDSQALQLFRNKLKGDYDAKNVDDLRGFHDNIPLVITQTATYLKAQPNETPMTERIGHLWQDSRMKMTLLHYSPQLKGSGLVPAAMRWQTTFERVRHKRSSSLYLLAVMSLSQPHSVPEFVLRDSYETIYRDRSKRDEMLKRDLEALQRHFLLWNSTEKGIYQTYSLVQLCIRDWLTRLEGAEKWRQVFVGTMSRCFPSGDFETWPTCRMLLPHIEHLFMEDPPEKEPEAWIRLMGKAGTYLYGIGKYGLASSIITKALPVATKVLGAKFFYTVDLTDILVMTLFEMRRVKEAEAMAIKTLDLRKAGNDDSYLRVPTAMSNLGEILFFQIRLVEAEELQRAALEMMKTMHGETSISTLTCMSLLGRTLIERDQWEEAEELMTSALNKWAETHEKNHPGRSRIMSHLALLRSRQCKWADATALTTQVLEIDEKTLGKEHPTTFKSRNVVSRLLSKQQQKVEEAESLQKDTLHASKRAFGEQHPVSLSCMYTMALIWRRLGREKEASDLLSKCDRISKIVYGLGPEAVAVWRTDKWGIV